MNIRQELAEWKIGRRELAYGAFVIAVIIFIVAMPTYMNSEKRAYEVKGSLVAQRLNASSCVFRYAIPKEKTCIGYAIPVYQCEYTAGDALYTYYYDPNEDKIYPISYDNYSMLKGECNTKEVG